MSQGHRFDITGRVAIVTGASSGIGARLARVLHEEGASVVLAARRADRIAALAAELGADRAHAVPTDVTDEAAVRALIAATLERFGRLDIMVNNAGAGNVAPAHEETTEDFRRLLETNLVSVFVGCREAALQMMRNGGGAIVNVASVLGLTASWHIPEAAYCASKGGVVNLTRELGAQWARHGVRVNALAPGWFRSEMTGNYIDSEEGAAHIDRTIPAGRGGDDHELDGALLFLASDASSYVFGQTIAVDGGYTAY